MPFAVELSMDDHAVTALRQIWRSLVQENIPSQPLALGARPHVSLCVYDSIESSVAGKQLETFAGQIGTIPFQLDTAKTFPGSNGVVFLVPRQSEELSEVHSRFHKNFAGHSATASQYYLPAYWKPHSSRRPCRRWKSNEPSRFVKERLFLFEGSLPRSAY
jgi:hypothetical protein